MVILPDYYAGKMINPMTSPREEIVEFIKKETDWEGTLKSTWESKIKPYAVNHGAKTFGAIGMIRIALFKGYLIWNPTK